MPAASDDTIAFLQLSLQEFNALKALANETFNQPPPLTNAYTACNNLRSPVVSTQTSQPLFMPNLHQNIKTLFSPTSFYEYP